MCDNKAKAEMKLTKKIIPYKPAAADWSRPPSQEDGYTVPFGPRQRTFFTVEKG